MASTKINPRLLVAELTVGIIFCLFNFRSFLAYAADHWAPVWVAGGTHLLIRGCEGALSLFTGSGAAWSPALANWLVLGFWCYVAAMAGTAVVLTKFSRLGNGFAGLLLGLASIVLLSWIGLLLV
ncbi:MAG TPA: hypothetical protein VGO40_04360, partial [Longimicrobium sp.]|nr:hypothetical protein [Longimicrobium sp.]